MHWTIERLRLAILVVAAVLLLSIVGSMFYGRWRLRHLTQDLPARLGIQIKSTTQSFVLSKTEEGRKIFTLHAARAISFKTGGRVMLHDVEIDLYNRENDQVDTIAGKDFEYDQDTQTVIAQDEAHITLHAPPSSHSEAATNPEAQIIHITTHGLVFRQKTGEATCSGEVDFQYSKSTGEALGASYDSKQGHLILQSQVVLTTQMQNQSAVVHASHAVYDRQSSEVYLLEPRYSSSAPGGEEYGRAGAATVLLRADGSAERLDAQNAVELVAADGTGIRATSMQIRLDEKNQPQQAYFSGGVQLTQNQATQQTVGNGREAVVDFDANGHAHRVTLDGDVNFQQQMDADQNQLYRTLTASHLVLHLRTGNSKGEKGKGESGQAQLQEADATGNAVFTSENTAAGHPSQKTRLAAQTLKATFLAGNAMQHLDGTGQTQMRMVAPNRDIDTSTGDVLAIDFVPGRPKSSDRGRGEDNTFQAQSIETAVQTGHVVLQQIATKKSGTAANAGSQVSTATAARAEYDRVSDTLTMTGEPVFRDANLEMTAERFDVQRAAGNMLATGAVQTTLRSNSQTSSEGLLSGNQPMHVIAQQALLVHDSQKAVFTGRARLWQGENSVEAPAIELSQKMQTLTAYGHGSCVECVHTTFLGNSAESAQPGRPKASEPNKSGNREPSTFRVLSGRLLYSDAERKASFSDHVEAISSDGEVFADRADVFLTPAGTSTAAKLAAPSIEKKEKVPLGRNNTSQSSVERIVATGHVVVEQPGRRAMGTRLVYTASDGRFVLTGNGENPPQVVDANQGKVMGQVLTFSSPTQAIMVSGTPNEAAVTKTRVQKK